jgi:hypothetical protein
MLAVEEIQRGNMNSSTAVFSCAYGLALYVSPTKSGGVVKASAGRPQKWLGKPTSRSLLKGSTYNELMSQAMAGSRL